MENFVLEVRHPREWNAFARALIARGELETQLGVSHRYGSASYRFGCNVHCWPKEIAEELAYAEDTVLTTHTVLRRAQGINT